MSTIAMTEKAKEWFVQQLLINWLVHALRVVISEWIFTFWRNVVKVN